MSKTTTAHPVLVESQDPEPRGETGRSMSSFEYLRALVDGSMPTTPTAERI